MTTISVKRSHGGTYLARNREVTSVALRSIIFDCDGVLVDSEPLHYASFKKSLGKQGEQLSEELYKERYLALDDKGAFNTFFQNQGGPLSETELGDFLAKKAAIFQELVASEGLLPYPAVPEFVMAVSQRYPLAVASGARRHEVEMVLEAAGIRSYFEAIVTADDVTRGKPDPESYLKAIDELNATGKRLTPIKPEECVVIEDSKQGIASAHTAGMKCVAVATSYPSFELSGADLVVPSIASLRVSQIEDLFHQQAPMPLPHTPSN